MSRNSPAMRSPVHIPATDDDDLQDFPDEPEETGPANSEEEESTAQEKSSKRVSLLRRGITSLLKIKLETPDDVIIEFVRQMTQDHERIKEIEKRALASDHRLKQLKKELLKIAVGDLIEE